MNEKISTLLKSPVPGDYILGMQLLKELNPAVWCALLNYVGVGEITDDVLLYISSKREIVNIGHRIKYKAITGPDMVVTNVSLVKHNASKGPGGVIQTYYTKVQAKYWNKSNQTLTTIEDRLECFELVKQEI